MYDHCICDITTFTYIKALVKYICWTYNRMFNFWYNGPVTVILLIYLDTTYIQSKKIHLLLLQKHYDGKGILLIQKSYHKSGSRPWTSHLLTRRFRVFHWSTISSCLQIYGLAKLEFWKKIRISDSLLVVWVHYFNILEIQRLQHIMPLWKALNTPC